MKAPFGVAILGGGIFVKEQHLPAILACKLLNLRAIYSRTLKSAQETAALIPAHHNLAPDLYSSEDPSATGRDDRSLEHLLARDDVHCVIVALPIVAQTEFVRKALRAGKHVLAEKPMAKDVATARALAAAAREEHARCGATLSIAENFRFHDKFAYAAQRARGLGGAVEHFAVRVMFCISAETDKYYKTEWRKVPEYMGGFLLDGGVHFAAGARMLLDAGGAESAPEHVHAFAAQVQPHLPPMDTVAAIIRTRGGATGVFQLSVGSQCSAFEFDFAYVGGSVKVSGDTVTVRRKGGEPEVKEFDRSNGVVEEVQAWAEAMEKGEVHARQTPREALNDLEFMQKILESGDAQGAALRYEFE